MPHQVGGHSCDKTSLKVYQGRVLKPFQTKNRGETELAFYERIASRSLPYFPVFYGVVELPSSQELRRYLQLEDLLSGMTQPCIMDVKIGTHSYDPTATPAKIELEAAKCPLQAIMGFRLQGIKVYWDTTAQFHDYDKHYFRALTTEDAIEESFARYFENGHHEARSKHLQIAARADRVHAQFLRKIKRIRAWIATQTEFQFIASSLLFVYDASNAASVDVRFIDFAHVQFDQGKVDTGVLVGLDRILCIFRHLLDSIELPSSRREAMLVDDVQD
ncbi:hypothetical protein DYB32_002779 [Aphanomyces invadans]|uniref:Kinase n=1 Tax=Aphanomyces invadans TaxID=157072 RepID=A0A3R6Z7B1_9STRA|nr:hypothetical protein DYB32_002779 [Aphanomyces invadans]